MPDNNVYLRANQVTEWSLRIMKQEKKFTNPVLIVTLGL
jgi:hypothetical protein